MDNILGFLKFLFGLGGPLILALLALILFLGLLILFPALTGQSGKPRQDPKSARKQKSRVGSIVEDLNEQISQGKSWARWLFVGLTPLILVGWIIVIFSGVVGAPPPVVHAPSASLLSASYSYADWDPRIIDLRKASTVGIDVGENISLHLFDLWVFSNASDEDTGFQVKVEIYSGDDLIGETEPVGMQSGAFQMGDVKPVNYVDGNNPDSWLTQPDWTSLSVNVICLNKGDKVSETVNLIRVSKANQSFLTSSPMAHFVSIGFSVNDEAPRVLDLSEAETRGIGVYGGSTLEIRSIRVRTSRIAPEEIMLAEAYIYENGWEPEIDSRPVPFSDTNVSIPLDQPMRWEITDQDKALVITLYREDGTVLDSYEVPLRSNRESALIDYSTAVVWPFEKITYLDFEKYSEIQEWQPENSDAISLDSSTIQAFSGHRSLSVYLNAWEAGETPSQYILYRNKPFQSNLLIGQVYWPTRDGIEIPYAALCLGELGQCFDLPESARTPDRWNTIYIDLASVLDENDRPLSSREFSSFYLQTDVRGIQADEPYIFYLDGFQLFPSTDAK